MDDGTAALTLRVAVPTYPQAPGARTSSLQAPIMLLTGHGVSLLRGVWMGGGGEGVADGTPHQTHFQPPPPSPPSPSSPLPIWPRRRCTRPSSRPPATALPLEGMIDRSVRCCVSQHFLAPLLLCVCGPPSLPSPTHPPPVLWNTFGDCENYAVLSGHGGAVLELHWSENGERMVSCSSDKTAAVWDMETGSRLRRMRGHGNVVNSCSLGRGHNLLVTGSDDSTVKVCLWAGAGWLRGVLLSGVVLERLLTSVPFPDLGHSPPPRHRHDR